MFGKILWSIEQEEMGLGAWGMSSLDELPWFVLARGSAHQGWAGLFGGVPGMLAHTVLWATISTAISLALQGSVEVSFATWC